VVHPARTRSLLDGIPPQRDSGEAAAVPGTAAPGTTGPGFGATEARTAAAAPASPVHETAAPAGFATAPDASRPAIPPISPHRAPSARRRLLRLLPTPAGAPFTLGYALVLLATSLFADHADPDIVADLLRGSSTDVAHLSQTPLLVLVGSALWVAGGMFSPYAVGFLLVLTALERRIGGWRTAAVFLVGHVAATLATELPVALSVAVGHLPDSSLHRLDYGISFGLMTSLGALTGLVPPLLRWPVLGVVAAVLLQELLSFTDPLTGWGHPMALAIGIACWPLVRRWNRKRSAA
jgi:hypothetical protein